MPYKYPLENQEKYRSKIQFQAYKVIPPDVNLPTFFKSTPAYDEDTQFDEGDVGNTAEETYLPPEEAVARAITNAAQGQYSLGLEEIQGKPMQIKEVSGELCNLYMPITFSVNDGFQFDTANLNFAGATALGAIQSGGGIIGSALNAISQGFSSTFDLFRGNLNPETSRLAASRLAANFPGLPSSIKAAIPLAVGVTMNPNVRAVFRSVTLREFTFQFKFIAKSREEAEEIKRIVKFFRKNAYPEDITVENISVGYKFPNLFKIKLMHQASASGKFVPVGTQIKLAYIRAIQTNYNPTAAVFHSDGNPIEVDMSVTFTEYKTLSRSDLAYDYTDYDPDLAPPPDGPSDTFGD